MKTKNFILGSIVGCIVYYLLGWLAYGILFKNIYPPSENENLLFYILGSLAFAMLLAYVFNKWANISTWATGAKAGAVITLFMALWMSFFRHAHSPDVDFKIFLLDIVIMVIMGAITGAVIALVSGKVDSKE